MIKIIGELMLTLKKNIVILLLSKSVNINYLQFMSRMMQQMFPEDNEHGESRDV